jgi:hypothetical protein
MWMSGRTSLLLTMGSLAAVLLVLRGRPFLALHPAAVALIAKDETFLLPLNLFIWWLAFRREQLPPARQITLWWLCAAALIGVYLALRFQTGAMTPWTAPPYYRFTANPIIIAKNVREYADRAMTFPAAVALLAWILLRPAPSDGGARTTRAPLSTPVLLCGAAWIVGGYGLTMFLPVRSSLYACFPAAGACLIAAHIASRAWAAAAPAARRRTVVAGIAATIGMAPVYVVRNEATLANARFSTRVLRSLDASTRGVAPQGVVVVLDDRTRKPNVETAFNTALADAFELVCGRRLTFWVEPELQHARIAGMSPPCAGCAAAVVDVRGPD